MSVVRVWGVEAVVVVVVEVVVVVAVVEVVGVAVVVVAVAELGVRETYVFQKAEERSVCESIG